MLAGLTREHIRRRIEAGLAERAQAASSVSIASEMEALVLPRPRASFRHRLKERLVESLMPALNLTSYNNLLRSQARWIRTSEERDRLQREVKRLSAEREELLRMHQDELRRHELKVRALATERDQLTAALRAALEERDRLATAATPTSTRTDVSARKTSERHRGDPGT